jgi:hypothetical protein
MGSDKFVEKNVAGFCSRHVRSQKQGSFGNYHRYILEVLWSKLYLLDVRSLWALLSLSFFEANLVAFLQSLVTFFLDFRKVHKQVLSSVVRSNESIPFGFIEPLYCTLHYLYHLLTLKKKYHGNSNLKLSW